MKIVRNYSKKLTILRNKSAVKIFGVKKPINKYIAYKQKDEFLSKLVFFITLTLISKYGYLTRVLSPYL